MRTGRALIDDCWLDGTILPGFCDSQVHLGFVDAAELVPHGIARVLDLGWDPEIARHWPSLAHSGGLAVDITGSILTARGGYPGSSDWAPPAAAREIHTPADAESAIADIRSIGGRVAKIALNSDAGPVWPDDLLEVVVSIAHRSGPPVVAHPGMPSLGHSAARSHRSNRDPPYPLFPVRHTTVRPTSSTGSARVSSLPSPT